jgi:hypothetical protein
MISSRISASLSGEREVSDELPRSGKSKLFEFPLELNNNKNRMMDKDLIGFIV